MILMCPYCGRRFVVPPHREAEPAQRCPNCGSSFDVSRGKDEEAAPQAAAPTTQKRELQFPDHSINPAECEIVRELSRDGAGILYLAKHPEVQSALVLKAFLPGYPVDEDTVARWTRSCRQAEKITHPRIARVLGVGLYENVPCVARQYIEGEPLDRLLAQKVMDIRQGTFLMGQALEGLEAAHSHRFCHGNIKPSNIIVDRRGRPFLCDFGQYPAPSAPRDAPHQLSSWAYQDPEVLGGADATASSDIYSVGAVLYEIATGRPPFDPQEMDLRMKRRDDFPAPESLNRRLSGYLSYVIGGSLQADPGRRYTGAHAMQVDLKRVYKGQKPLSYKPRRAALLRFMKVMFYFLLFAALTGSAGFGAYRWYDARLRDAARESLEKGRRALADGRFKEAAAAVSGVPNNYPPLGVSACIITARSALGGGNFSNALDAVNQAQQRFDVSGRALVELRWLEARGQAALGKFKDAADVLASLDPLLFSKVVPEEEVRKFAYAMGQLHSQTGAAELAAQFLLEPLMAKASHPATRARLHLVAGMLMESAGKRSEAAAQFRAALEGKEPLAAAASEFRLWLEDSPAPVDEKTAGLLSPYPAELARLAVRRYLQDRVDEARLLASRLRGIEQLPELPARLLRFIDAREKQLAGSRQQALEEYGKLSLREDEAGLWALFLASQVRLDSGQTGIAEKGFAALMSKRGIPEPLPAESALYLGHCWRARGKSDQAITFYRNARENTDDKGVKARAMLAEIEACCETRALKLAEGLLADLKEMGGYPELISAAAFLLGEENNPPPVSDPHHRRYLEALRYEISGRNLDAYQNYRLLVEGAEGRSWYASAARFRLQILRR